MGPPGQQYGSDQYRGQGQYGSYPGSGQQLGPPGHHDGGGRGGFNIGGLFNRAKDIAAKAADAASVFVAGGPDLVPPPQFQDQINALPGQSGMGFSGPGVPPGAGAFGPGGPPPPPPPLGRTDPDIPGGYTSTGQQEEQGRGFGDAMADGAKGLFGRVRGLFAEEERSIPTPDYFQSGSRPGQGQGEYQHHYQNQGQGQSVANLFGEGAEGSGAGPSPPLDRSPPQQSWQMPPHPSQGQGQMTQGGLRHVWDQCYKRRCSYRSCWGRGRC